MFRNSLKMLLGGKTRKNNGQYAAGRAPDPGVSGGVGVELEGSEVGVMEGLSRSLPSSPLLNLRLLNRAGRNAKTPRAQRGALTQRGDSWTP
ncbi:hypothetical protein EYF80_066615 [Liparis tanakae]|uniref:Uncharacterized protein n=1 Tax=Liparis tanakae TaxID=230148 RepID=A0A4Z2E2Y4_9TELE|nr:hypothetical protein EYF80_066615 [Liparis tanakae]